MKASDVKTRADLRNFLLERAKARPTSALQEKLAPAPRELSPMAARLVARAKRIKHEPSSGPAPDPNIAQVKHGLEWALKLTPATFLLLRRHIRAVAGELVPESELTPLEPLK
jgi:hypothetical protein